MQVLNGDPGSAGVSTSLPPEAYVHALDGDDLPRIAGYDGTSAGVVPRPREEGREAFGPVAGERTDSTTAYRLDCWATSLLKTWPGGLGEVFEAAPRERPTRLVGPVQFVLKLMEHWRLDSINAVGLLGFDRSDFDYVTSVLEGRERLRGKDVRDRIVHLYGIRKSLRFLFQDLETENAWLREPHEELYGKSPMSLLLSGSMENLLAVKDYVDVFAGR